MDTCRQTDRHLRGVRRCESSAREFDKFTLLDVANSLDIKAVCWNRCDCVNQRVIIVLPLRAERGDLFLQWRREIRDASVEPSVGEHLHDAPSLVAFARGEHQLDLAHDHCELVRRRVRHAAIVAKNLPQDKLFR